MAVNFPITFEHIKTLGVHIQSAVKMATKIKTVKVSLLVLAVITIVPILGYLAYLGIQKITHIRAEKRTQKELEKQQEKIWHLGIGAVVGIATTVGIAGLFATTLCATETGASIIASGVKSAIATNYGSQALMQALSSLAAVPEMTGLQKFAVLLNYAYPVQFDWLNNIFNLPNCTGTQIITLLMNIKKSA